MAAKSPAYSFSFLSPRAVNLLRRPVYLFWLSFLAVSFFAFTFALNRLYAGQQQRLSRYWYGEAQRALESHNPEAAVSDLRTALMYSHDQPEYLFALAQALEARGRISEARAYLLSLLEDEPGNGAYNLELAHLAVKENDVSRAMRYFNGAIYGAWEQDPILKRQHAREELVTYLLDKGMTTQAQGELLTFTTDMPKTLEASLWVADAFSRLGNDSSALQFYRSALRLDRRNVAAMLGAGQSSYHLRRYREALKYFRDAAAVRADAKISRWVELARMTLDLDASDARIDASERRHRLILAMDVADRRLRSCPAAQALPSSANTVLQDLRSQWMHLDAELQRARNDSDVVQFLAPVGVLIRNIEQQPGCGAPTVDDQAVLQIYANAEELQP